MKQILQSLKSGETFLEDVPAPIVNTGCVLIKTTHSLVSIGTERMLVEFGRANIFKKALNQPEKVEKVIRKLKTDGLKNTISAISNKLDDLIPLGYCNIGEIIDIGENVSQFSIGDRVISNGPHAEIVNVSKNLVVKVPENVNDEDAVFTVISSVALQGVRLTEPTFGETFVVVGLGLIGLITCQILRANGCRVIGLDVDQEKCKIAKKLGFENFSSNEQKFTDFVLSKTDNIGADGVIIAASTKSNQVISQAAEMSRKRGRICLIGVVGMNLKRADFYKKELTFKVSCSYGPGRYDSSYEKEGIDYPLPFVRWTQKRNFKSILDAISEKKLIFENLITKRTSLNNYKEIYDNINNSDSLASILIYGSKNKSTVNKNIVQISEVNDKRKTAAFGIIGAGNYVKMTALPILNSLGADIKYISSNHGISSNQSARKYGIRYNTTDMKNILDDKKVASILIMTRHDSHSKLTIEALKSEKNVFVEKPLALNQVELDKINKVYKKYKKNIFVGFNRRFSAHSIKIKKELGKSCNNLNITVNMNAGYIDSSHWVHDMNIGGGRIIGEACHMIDLCVFLTGSLVSSVCASSLGKQTHLNSDNVSILLKFFNGSNAVINYFSNGSIKYSKERVEVFHDKQTWILDNFQKTTVFSSKYSKTLKTKLDKGHSEQFKKYIDFIKNGGKPLIRFNEIYNVSKATISVIDSLKSKRWIEI